MTECSANQGPDRRTSGMLSLHSRITRSVNRHDVAASVMAISLVLMGSPGLAEEKDPIPPAKQTSNQSTPPSSKGTQAKGTTGWKKLPKTVFGVVSGVIIGTPVCIVRNSLAENRYAVKEMGGSDNPKKRVTLPVSVLWSPFSLVSGTLEAPFYALNNSLVNYDKPFSKEQFSLTEYMEQSTKQDPLEGTSER